MTDNAQLRGVGGWLAFLIYSRLWASAPWSVVTTLGEIRKAEDLNPAVIGSPIWEQMQISTWATVLFGVAICVITSLLMLKHHEWGSVRAMIAGLWVAGPLVTAANLAICAWIAKISLWGPASYAATIPTLFPAIVWTAYLLRSRRVANTYPRAANPPPASA